MTRSREILQHVRALVLGVSGLEEAQVHYLTSTPIDEEALPDITVWTADDRLVTDSEDSAGGMQRELSVVISIAAKSLEESATDDMADLCIRAVLDSMNLGGRALSVTWTTQEWGELEGSSVPMVCTKLQFNVVYAWSM